jgi:type IV secretory pathway VirB10-like protein
MKVSTASIFMVLLFALGACSGEDQPQPQTPPPKVVQSIKPSTADVEKPTTTVAEEKKPQVPEKAQMENPAVSQEKPGPAPAPAAEEKKAAPEKREKEEPGVYVVKKGDTLSSIAARPEILNDPLKWTILLSLNREQLGEWATGDNLPERELPQGTKLRVMTAREAGASPNKTPGALWVVNVLSSPSSAEIVPPAVALVKQGYPVYIVRANVKGKDYMRLRVGFFKKKSEADEVGTKIKELLNFQDSWSTKADKEEYDEVTGFVKSIEQH